MMSEQLKPCPFCGGKAKFQQIRGIKFPGYRIGVEYGYIKCMKCGASSERRRGGKLFRKETAAKYWNTRHNPVNNS